MFILHRSYLVTLLNTSLHLESIYFLLVRYILFVITIILLYKKLNSNIKLRRVLRNNDTINNHHQPAPKNYEYKTNPLYRSILFNMSAFQIFSFNEYLNYSYISFLLFFINAFFIVMNAFELITFDEEEDVETKNNIQRTIQLYNIGQIILITAINIIMIILGNKLINCIINIGTYYILLYILYRMTKLIITNSKSQHIKRKTI